METPSRQASETAAATPGRLLLAAMALMDRALDQLGDTSLSAVDDDDLIVALDELPRLEARFDAATTAIVDVADTRHLARRRRFRDTAQFMASRTNVAPKRIRAKSRIAKWLRDFPDFTEAFQAGDVSTAHLERIRLGLDNGRTHGALRRMQRTLIAAARDCSFQDFERVCDYWRIAADPDGDEPRDQIARARFRARRRTDGMVELDGLLDPLSGAVFLTAWESEFQRLLRADEQQTGERSDGKRGVEALLRLTVRGAARANGAHPDPLIHIAMSLKVAEDTMRRLVFGDDGSPIPVDPEDVDGRCELIDGTPIHPHLAMAVLGIAALQRIVMTATSRELDVSVKARGFPKWMRYIMLLRSRGRCEEDGCDAPYPWLQADHDLAHSKGGPTALDNGVMRCRPHNLAKGDR